MQRGDLHSVEGVRKFVEEAKEEAGKIFRSYGVLPPVAFVASDNIPTGLAFVGFQVLHAKGEEEVERILQEVKDVAKRFSAYAVVLIMPALVLWHPPTLEVGVEEVSPDKREILFYTDHKWAGVMIWGTTISESGEIGVLEKLDTDPDLFGFIPASEKAN